MNLFEPITINGMTLKNRIVMPPMQLNLGLTGPRAIAYYKERAQGGTGCIIAAATPIDVFTREGIWEGKGGFNTFMEGVKVFTKEIQQAGAKIGVQLQHRLRYPEGFGLRVAGEEVDVIGDRVGPSPTEDTRALTIEEIKDIVERFGKAAARAREADFDFVEIHGAHGYLLCSFFSLAVNHRTDIYGGNLINRMRLGIECVQSVRKAVGADYPVFYRIGAMERIRGGIKLKDSTTFSRELGKAGVDVLDVSLGKRLRPEPALTKRYPMGGLVFLAEAIKKDVGIPVISGGRINAPEVAENILTQGKADLVAIGRQLICDPLWPRKVREGRAQDIFACNSCSTYCYAAIRKRRVPKDASFCKFNKRAGKEWVMPLQDQA